MQQLVELAGPLPGPAPQRRRPPAAAQPASSHFVCGSCGPAGAAEQPEPLSAEQLAAAQGALTLLMLAGMDLVSAVAHTVQVRSRRGREEGRSGLEV
jgi:hypothetical protein